MLRGTQSVSVLYIMAMTIGASFSLPAKPKTLGLADRIMPFPPGHYYKGGKFICYPISLKSIKYAMTILKPPVSIFVKN